MKQTEDAETGRDAEFREFVRSRATPLHRSAYLLCGDRHLADDVVQDTLVKAYQHWRRRERSVPVAEFADEPTAADPSDDVVRRDGLRQALLTLPLRQRATVVLRYLEGLSERETAAVLGCSTGTVKSQSSPGAGRPQILLRPDGDQAVNTEQENRLREDLRRAVDGESFRIDPDVVLRRARRARRRTLVVRGAAGAGALAVAIAATLAVSRTGVPEVRNAAYVVERVSAALDGRPGYVYRIVDHDEGTVWYQDLLDTTVNHKDRTFSTEDVKLPGYVAGELPPRTSFVDRIKKAISGGGHEIVGSGEYRGHQVIKLGYSAGELWVDATTYLPVYRITTETDGRKTTSDLAFLPRTPDLVKTVNTPQVPAGYTKVAEANTGPGHGG